MAPSQPRNPVLNQVTQQQIRARTHSVHSKKSCARTADVTHIVAGRNYDRYREHSNQTRCVETGEEI